MIKNNEQQQYADVLPVFRLQPQSDTHAKCRHIGFCKDISKMTDEPVEEDVKLPALNNYAMIGKFCACNILGNYLVQNTTLPVFYMAILYSKKFVMGCLFNITVYFTVSPESKKKLDNPKKYVGALIDGVYTIEISIPEENDFLKKIKPIVKDSIFPKFVKEFDTAETEEEQSKVIDKIDIELNSKMETYGKFLENIKLDRLPNKKFVYEKLKEMITSPLFRELMIHGMILREKERAEERGPDMSFEPPKNVINLKEIGDDPAKMQEVLDARKKKRTLKNANQ